MNVEGMYSVHFKKAECSETILRNSAVRCSALSPAARPASLIEHRNPGPQGQVTEKGFAIKLLPFELLKTMFCPPTVELATFYGVG
jgi:hypothetical protein